MQIQELVSAATGRWAIRDLEVVGDATTQVTTAVHDSRQVAPGTLFACVPGAAHDGHDFAAGAVAAGAAALVCERPLDLGVPELRVASAREALGPLAATLAGNPADRLAVVGVTGTNGKTTVTHLLGAVLAEAGTRCGVIGTLSGARTTPEAPELQAQLAGFVAEGAGAVAMEVSSHALDLHRVDGITFAVAAFTNLSQDHLDHHGTMAAYFQAKARLFEPGRCRRAVLNLDDPHGRLLFDAATVPSTGCSLDDVTELVLGPDGSTFRWHGAPVHLRLAGRFNVSNAIVAATIAAELGIDPATVAAGLTAAEDVSGRFERVEVGQPFLAAVDYAHTPDGLDQLLAAARELTPEGQVIVVFGAGGDRDRSKRPLMGAAASRGADVIFLTTDNPRGEDPAAIIDDVHHGIDSSSDLHLEPDRARAIAAAVAVARPGDVLLVAGKGHETTQVTGDRTIAFDDRTVLRDALLAAGHGPAAGEAST